MVITLYGPDSYRRLQRLNELVNSYIEKRGSQSHERIRLEKEEDLIRLKDYVGSQSMFSPKKLVILDNPFEYKDKKELKKILKDNTEEEDTNIIINTEKKYTAPFKFLEEKPNRMEEFKKLEGAQLSNFIKKEGERLGYKLDQVKIDEIKTHLGTDTWRIVTELERLALSPDSSPTSNEENINYFSTLGSLSGGRDVGQRLVALEDLLSGARYDAERVFNGMAFRPGSENRAEMYADYNAATRAGRLEYEEILLAIALGLKFNPLD